jgi:transcriptional regulator with XRE-family HTH domain
METTVLLGRRLRELRKKRGLTQEGLAEQANVDVKYLGSIERGRENPTVGTLEKVSAALGIKMAHLLTYEHQLRGERLLRRRIAQVIERFDENELQHVLKLLNALKD